MERRTTLAGGWFFQFSLLLLVTTGFAAVVSTGQLGLGTAVAAGAALAARALIVAGQLRVPLPDWAVRVLTIAYIGFYPFDLLYISGSFLGASVRLVFFLAAIKLVTARTGRDYLYLGLIAFLELLSAAMLSSSAAILVFLVLFLVFAVAARASWEIQRSVETAEHRAPLAGSPGWRLAALSAVLAAGITAVGFGLFFVVPRAAGAYLSRLPATGETALGFSNEVVLGTTGRLKLNPEAVMRVRILDGKAPANLKWRGAVLQHFDGVRWSNPWAARTVEAPHGQYLAAPGRERLWWGGDAGSRIRFRVTRAPIDSDVLFLPGSPQWVEGDFARLGLSDTECFSVPGARWKALHYNVTSVIGPRQPTPEADRPGPYPFAIRAAYLQLPPLDPRIPQLAHYVTDSQRSPYWRAVALEHYFRTEFGYTLELPSERPADPLADFLFRRKKGHCEYFAASMAVMLRTLGIPARLASGFQSGIYNPVSGYYTIRQTEAHAWVEAYFPGLGWVTFDPSPPDPSAGVAMASSWFYLDALDAFWNDWVVQYDVSRQLNLARAVQAKWYDFGYEAGVRWDRGWDWVDRRLRHLRQTPEKSLVVPVVGLAVFALVVWAAAASLPRIRAALAARRVKRGGGDVSDCALLYRRCLEHMRRRGFIRASWQTAAEFAASVGPACPERGAALLREITAVYNRARFGYDRGAARELAGLVGVLEKSGRLLRARLRTER